MNEFKFSCPHCGQHILRDLLSSDREINCPACQKPLIVPAQAPPGTAVAELMPATLTTAAGSTPGVPGHTVSPDSPSRIPLVVRIYGILTMALGVLGIIMFVLFVVSRPGAGALGLLLGGVGILLMAVVFRVGMGMRSGERQAIYGFCLLALIEGVFRLFSFAAKHNTQHLWYLVFALGLFFAPPLVSAFRHWAAFK
jgi:DNA-directed RNA polymerase subunit RPC12/RpoP